MSIHWVGITAKKWKVAGEKMEHVQGTEMMGGAVETVPRVSVGLGKYNAEFKIWGGGEMMLVIVPRVLSIMPLRQVDLR